MNFRTVPRRTLPALMAGLIAGALAVPAAARAGGVALLQSSDLAVYEQTVNAFRRAHRTPVREFSLARLSPEEAVGRIESAKPEVIVAVGLRAAALIHARMPRTPLVFCMVPSPERYDLVGEGITGVSADIPPALELALLRGIAPDVRRVGVLVGRDAERWVGEASAAAEQLGIVLVVSRAATIGQLGPGLRSLLSQTDAIWMPADGDIATPEAFRLTVEEALAHQVPFFTFAPALVRAGALAAAAADLEWVGRWTADAVRRVQSGERAADVPPTRVRRARLIVNLSTARALGRVLPPAGLLGAELVP